MIIEQHEVNKETENILRNMCAGRNYREWSTDMIDKLYPYIIRVIEDDLENQDETVDPLAIGRLSVTEDMVVTALMMYAYENNDLAINYVSGNESIMSRLSEIYREAKRQMQKCARDCKDFCPDYEINSKCECERTWLVSLLEELQEYRKRDWIPCTVVDHPEHCNYCEITYQDTRGYSRGIGYYADRWILVDGEVPVIVIAWKEPSKPYEVVS